MAILYVYKKRENIYSCTIHICLSFGGKHCNKEENIKKLSVIGIVFPTPLIQEKGKPQNIGLIYYVKIKILDCPNVTCRCFIDNIVTYMYIGYIFFWDIPCVMWFLIILMI